MDLLITPKQDKSILMRRCILYSGGLDSFILSYLNPDTDCIYFDIGSRYTRYEIQTIKKNNVRVIKLDFFTNAEHDNGYMPYRNMILILKTTLLGYNQVLFGVVNEWQTDKNKRFFKRTERLAKVLGKTDLQILTPFKYKNKWSIVSLYLKAGGDVEKLYTHSRSCIKDQRTECGQCVNCERKYIALIINDVYKKGYFDYQPTVAEIRFKFIKRTFITDFKLQKMLPAIGRLYELQKAMRAEKRYSS